MSPARLGRVFGFDLRWHLRRPLFWIWILVLGLTAWGLSGGHLTISSGEAQVGGSKAWLTSQFSLAQLFSLTVFLFYNFFMAVLAGMTVVQDEEEWRVGELLHATPLRPREYVWGKAGAALATFLVALVAHLGLTIVFFHLVPHPASELFGPFSLSNYLIPAVAFALPPILFVGGVSFMLGEVTRRPVVVYLFPIALVGLAFFLWEWSPAWLAPEVNRLLMWIDVSGFRWLNETWLQVDRGVEFYNTRSIRFDAGFVISRAVLSGAGLAAVAASARRFAHRLRGVADGREEGIPAAGAAVAAGRGAAEPRPAAAVGGAAGLRLVERLRGLGMRTRVPGALRTGLRVARAEGRELASSPGLYLFVPLILLQTLGSTLIATGPFHTRLIFTSGGVAVRAFNTLALLVSLLLLFYTVEALERDEATGLAAITDAAPLSSLPLFLGKGLAMVGVSVVVTAGALAGAAVAILAQGVAPVEPAAFGWVWGLGLVPTFVVWIAFLTAVHALTGSRHASYGLGLGALALTLWRQFTGEMTWVGNWMLWDALRWTDMGVFPLNREPLLLNRLLWLSMAGLLFALAAAWHRRREGDAVRLLDRLRPRAVLGGVWRLAPLAVVPLAVGGWLWVGVQDGFQGAGREDAAEDYWKRNLATYRDHPLPGVDHLDLDLSLDPASRRLESRGELTLVNRTGDTLHRVPVTGGFHWRDLRWTMNGDSVEPEDRAGLYVFRPDRGVAPGDTLRVGWSFHGRHPEGWTENGGGTGTFVLSAGVVIHTLRPIMAPVPGYVEAIGRTDARDYEPPDRPPDWWRGPTDPLVGAGSPFTARVRVDGPAGWRYNSVGVLVADSTRDGRRYATWETETPVRLLNVVAGRWKVRRGERTRVWYHPEHTYNLDEIARALQAARQHYAGWFARYPWEELKLSEFPDLAQYAQGFPTNITFSEGIGFLTKSVGESDAAFLVTAHEAAHQWWGNILTPGEGPGGNVLSEGLAHFSTALLMREELGEPARRDFMRRIEEGYGEERRADAERPLLWTDGTRPGDRSVTYDKGGWAFWMLMEVMGRGAMLDGLSAFIDRYRHGPDYPVLQDFLRHMQRFAPDTARFREAADRWFRSVKVPEYRIREATVERDSAAGRWLTELTVENIGTGAPPVAVAVVRDTSDGSSAGADSLSGGDGGTGEGEDPPGRSAEVTIRPAGGSDTTVTLRSPFRPERAVVDPRVEVLMLERDAAERSLD